jgi:hypothetical protein
MPNERIVRPPISFFVCAALVACSEAVDPQPAARAPDKTAAEDLAPVGLAIPAVTGAWWTYSVESAHASYRSVQRVVLGDEIAPGRFSIEATVLAANGTSSPAFP